MCGVAAAFIACSDSPTDPGGPPVQPSAPQPAVRIEIVPGALLLTGSGASQKLSVNALDASGQPTTAAVTWRSSSSSVHVTSDGTATAVVAVGSAVITAETANGVTSIPIVAIVAQPKGGALLVSDDQVVGDLAQVDPAEELDIGWRYQVILRNTAAPAPGTIVLASGGAVVAGRVVTVASSGTNLAVTLELVPLTELFDALEFNIQLPLINEDLGVFSAATAANGPVLPVGPSRDEIEVPIGPFNCKLSAAVPLSFQNVTRSYDAGLTGVAQFSLTTGVKLAVTGTIAGQMTARPLIGATWTGNAKCEVNVPTRPWTLPIGGPLAWFYGLQVPTGIGVAVKGELEVGQVGFDIAAQASAQVQLGFECAPPSFVCGSINSFTPQADGSLTLIAPELGETRVALDGRGYLYAKLQLGPNPHLLRAASFLGPAVDKLTFKLLEASAGIEQSVDLAGAKRQATDPAYASSAELKFNGELKADLELKLGFEDFGKKLGYVFQILEEPLLAFETVISRSPRGSFEITPASVKAGNDDELGELATFTFTLDPVTYLGAYSVDGVEIRWLRPGTDGGFVLENGRPPCTDLQPTASGQSVFSCEVDFLEEHAGVQTFVGLVHARIFGVPLPVPLEVALDARATVEVTLEECPPSAGDGALRASIGLGGTLASNETCEEQLLAWDFLGGFEGWQVGTTEDGWGTVIWRDRRLGRDGVIHFDGVGGPGEPNSWIYQTVTVPANATTISFAAAPHDRDGGDTEMRVRVEDSSGAFHTVLDWTTLVGAEGQRLWSDWSAPIADFAGQTVTIYFEQNDNGPGAHEQLYIDFIKID